MDVSQLVLWLIGISTAAFAVRAAHAGARRHAGWLATCGIVLGTLGLTLWLAPELAAAITGAVWGPLLVAPLLFMARSLALAQRHRYPAAARYARWAARLQVGGGASDLAPAFEALEHVEHGERERALAVPLLAGPARRYVELMIAARDGRWEDVALGTRGCDGAGPWQDLMQTLRLRALGELGHLGSMLAEALRADREGRPTDAAHRSARQTMVLAFAGMPRKVAQTLGRTPEAWGLFWLATAHQRGGEAERAERMLRTLTRGADQGLAAWATHRLARPLDTAEDSGSGGAAMAWLAEELASHGPGLGGPTKYPAWATLCLLAGTVAAFALELPDPMDVVQLYDMGAMVAPLSVLDGQWWRLFAAGFLHFGWLHLLMNLVALWYFGRFVEAGLGTARTAALYLTAGAGAMGLFLGLATWAGGAPQLVVGASASVMGLVGASAALSLRRYRTLRSTRALRDLKLIGLLLALQAIFDLTTPQVSFIAHLGGVLMGLLLGLALRDRETGVPRARLA